jgi:transcriptional regulator with XRE-family HTH domain
MEQTVNERILILKDHLRLDNQEFIAASKISNGTLWNIENGKNISSKTIKVIAESLNVNLDWLKHGKGEMLAPQKEIAVVDQNPWKDEAYKALKDEVSFLRSLVSQLTGGKSANFHKALNFNAGRTNDARQLRASVIH